MKKSYIYKVYSLLLFSLFFNIISNTNLYAQCGLQTTDITITRKPAYCLNDGAISVSVANPNNYHSIKYGVYKDGTDPSDPANWVVPKYTENSVMSGFGLGNYILEVSVVCGPANEVNKSQQVQVPFSITQGTQITAPIVAKVNQSKTKFSSLRSYHSGEVTINITGGNRRYVVDIIEHPVAYNGPKSFLVNTTGDFLINGLAPTDPNNASIKEYYTFKISDGCNTEIILSGILINVVSQDLPSTLAQIGQTNALAYPKYKVGASGFPAHYQKEIYINYRSGTYNIHEFLNSSAAKDYYEAAASYSKNDPSAIAEADWVPFSESRLLFKGDFKGSQILADPTIYKVNGSGVYQSGTLPYIYIRLKEKPDVYQVYETVSITKDKPNFEIYPQSGGLKIRISNFNMSNPRTTFLTLPYQLRAVNTADNTSIIYSSPNPTFEIPNNPETAHYSEFQKMPDDIILPWGSGEWQLEIVGVADAQYGGDPDYSLKLSKFNVDDKNAFFDKNWGLTYGLEADCGVNFGFMRSAYIYCRYWDSDISNYIFPKYERVRAELISGPIKTAEDPDGKQSNSKQGLFDFYESGYISETDTYSSNMNFLCTNQYNPLALNSTLQQKMVPGLYKWRVYIYDETRLNVMATKDFEYQVIDIGELKVDETKTITVEKIPTSECYGARIRLDMDQLKDIALKKAAGSSNWEVTDVRIFLLEKSGNGYTNSKKMKIANFTFNTTGRPSGPGYPSIPSTASNYFLYSDLVNYTDLNGADPEFEIPYAGEYAIGVLPSYSTVYDYEPNNPTAARPTQEVVSSVNWGIVGNCRTPFPFTIDENDLAAVQLDVDRTGAYRCDKGTIGTYTINVITTQPTGTKLEYNIYAANGSGVKDAATYHYSITTTDLTIPCPDSYKVPVGVDYLRLEVKPEGCDVGLAIYILPVYNLKTSSLLGSSGGPQCQDGSTTGVVTPLELYAVWLPDTYYQWYYPDGSLVETTAGINGNTHHANIPPAKFQAGNYKCILTNAVLCQNEPYVHEIYVSEEGGMTLFWAVDAVSSDWRYVGNWRTSDGEPSLYVPDKCIDVVIPGKVNTYFPDLSVSSSGKKECRDIRFRYGGQLYHTELLDYRKAIVEYNVGYYNQAYPADDNVVVQPTGNKDEGLQPEAATDGGYVTDLATMTRNRWWMISSPLKEVYTGEFQFDGKPYTYRGFYNTSVNNNYSYVYNTANNPQTETELISVVRENNLNLDNYYNAMMFWVPAYNLAIGGSQDIADSKYGKVICSSSQTTFNTYDMLTLNIEGSNNITRKKVGRFIYEDASNVPSTTYYSLDIKADPTRTNGWVMIGNPFMTPISLSSFITNNTTVIDNSFKILTENGWETKIASGWGAIAPLQGFAVKLKNPTAAATLRFHYGIQTTVSTGRNVRLK